jgi:hypothetical protein
MLVSYDATSNLVHFENKIYFSTLKNALAYYVQRCHCMKLHVK